MLITLQDLTNAIENALEIEREEAYRYACIVLDFYGYDDRIIDNILTTEERQMFYRLEQKGILIAEREETVLPSGAPWRTHYWRLEKDTISRYIKKKLSPIKTGMRLKGTLQTSSYEDIYLSVPKEMWAARKTTEV